MLKAFCKHKDFSFEVITVGKENIPVIVVDSFIDSPERLVDAAIDILQDNADKVKYKEHFALKRIMYPGVCCSAPENYRMAVVDIIQPLVQQVYQLVPSQLSNVQADFSVVTTPPSSLHTRQRIPHCDGVNPAEIAMIYYLCDESFGGTSFYRHKRSGFEYVDQTRDAQYSQMLNKDIELVGMPQPPQYMNGDTALFERVYSCAAKFNRLLIYPCPILHSGDISDNYAFDFSCSDAYSLKKSRLTITNFMFGA